MNQQSNAAPDVLREQASVQPVPPPKAVKLGNLTMDDVEAVGCHVGGVVLNNIDPIAQHAADVMEQRLEAHRARRIVVGGGLFLLGVAIGGTAGVLIKGRSAAK